ncbi:MAG: DUF1491 family protein [Pseudomonadota bacterium]
MRLTARFWVDAYLARLRQVDIPAFVLAHGDDTAGAVLVKVNRLDGSAALYHRKYDILNDVRAWDVLESADDAVIDASIGRQRVRDPDLWVIEVEDKAGRHLLDAPGLA